MYLLCLLVHTRSPVVRELWAFLIRRMNRGVADGKNEIQSPARECLQCDPHQSQSDECAALQDSACEELHHSAHLVLVAGQV